MNKEQLKEIINIQELFIKEITKEDKKTKI